MFHSINCEYDVFDEVSKSFIANPPKRRNKPAQEAPLMKQNTQGDFEDILPTQALVLGKDPKFQVHWDRKQTILASEGFKAFPIIDTDPTREELPALKDPEETLNIWALLKDCKFFIKN